GALYGGGGDSIYIVIAIAVLKVVIVIVCLWFVARYILPHLFKYAAQSQELLFLTAVIWCFAVASGLQFLGFGIEIGALLAGISLAGSEFHREIESKIRPLRDFFLIIFFVVLGTHLSFNAVEAAWVPALIFSAFILIGNPFIVIVLMRLFGYHIRVGFLVGVTMAQISEFSFILLSVALTAGIIDSSVMTLATLVGLGTIAISTYLIKYNEQIYQKLEWAVKFMEKKPDKEKIERIKAPEILLLGYEYLSMAFLPAIKAMNKDYLVVDFNPVVIEKLKSSRIPHMYGDAGNEDFLCDIRAEKTELVISTIPDMTISTDLIAYLKSKRSRASIVVTAKTVENAKILYDFGATFVILPNILGGKLFAEILIKKKTKKSAWNAAAKSQQKILIK
ncbi:MAG: cation:proton antiporter, partial [Patescibacteria group bacterium]